MNNLTHFNLYIPSKGRSDKMITSKALTLLKIPHYIIVEPQEVEIYKKSISDMKLLTTVLTLDQEYKKKYELCDNYGLTKSTGPGPARNFAWDHSLSLGDKWHWVMDDNIREFYRLNNNEKIKIENGIFFKVMAGPNYYRFAPDKKKQKPFIINTRIYSCNLIRNDLPFRWRGRYNEDTILSLDMLSARWCTIQFNAFLQFKMDTQLLSGGNTSEFYHKEGQIKNGGKYSDKGTINKSLMLTKVYPNISKIVWRFNRWHHFVDYSKFKNNKLIRKPIELSKGINNYGIALIDHKDSCIK